MISAEVESEKGAADKTWNQPPAASVESDTGVRTLMTGIASQVPVFTSFEQQPKTKSSQLCEKLSKTHHRINKKGILSLHECIKK